MALQLHNKKHQRGPSIMQSNLMIEDPFGSMQMDVFGHMNNVMSHFNTMFSSPLTSFSSPFMQFDSERSFPFPSPPTQFPSPFPFGFSNLTSDPNCHMYSTSQVTSMAVGPDGRSQVYQASTSTKALPGGIRETKKTLCDSRSGVKKMSLGHHIGERGRVIERQKNLISGEEEEHQEFINLDEEEAERFDREFEHRVMNGKHALPAALQSRNKRKGNLALTSEGHRFNSAVSQHHSTVSRLASGRGNKGIIKGALRKIHK